LLIDPAEKFGFVDKNLTAYAPDAPFETILLGVKDQVSQPTLGEGRIFFTKLTNGE